jgi:predicted secreted protein
MAGTMEPRQRRQVIVTAVIMALIALGFYVGFFITMALR